MSKFKELNENVNKIMYKLISSQDLCKYLYYDADKPLEEANIDDTTKLLFEYIFPIPKINVTSSTKHSYLIFMFDNFHLSSNNKFKEALVKFDIICHIDLWKMEGTGMLRPYSIANEIDDLFNNQRGMGIGKAQFEEARFLPINDVYSGYRVVYKLYDFN